MDGKKILLILAVFLGISLADEVPGFSRDKSVPEKLGLGLWRRHKARDQHESEDTRSMNTKQTEESRDIEFRHRLPILDTAWFSHEIDEKSRVTLTPFCHSKQIRKTFGSIVKDGLTYTPYPMTTYDETICDPPDDFPSNHIEMIYEVAHQRCEMQLPQYYCFTTKKKTTVYYRTRIGRVRYKYTTESISLRTGCVCGSLDLRKR